MRRIAIFVDFWNFEISLRQPGTNLGINWQAAPRVLAEAANRIIPGPRHGNYSYVGMNVYLSYGPHEQRLKHWAETVLSSFAGTYVHGVERVQKSHVKCGSCSGTVRSCPHCDAELTNTMEKGVDTKLATDMLTMAWDDRYDVGVLVSADKDFVPAVKALGNHGIKIIQVGLMPKSKDLAIASWGSINLDNLADGLYRQRPSKHRVDTAAVPKDLEI